MNFTFYIFHSSLQRAKPSRREGFTLIELLSVMAVMILITTIVVTSGFGLRRSAALNAARQIPLNILEYAHQRACMDGRRTAVLFAPNGKNSDTYTVGIFQASGAVSDTANNRFTDYFSDIDEVPSGFNVLTVFNFDKGSTFKVGKIERQDGDLGKSEKFTVSNNDKSKGDFAVDGGKRTYYGPQIQIFRSSDDNSSIGESTWPKGSAYGFEIADRQVLPKNYDYSLTKGSEHHKDGDSFWIVYRPNGKLENGDEVQITIKEMTTGKSLDPITYK